MNFEAQDFADVTCGDCLECGTCRSEGWITCSDCDGEEHVRCYRCMGEREWKCEVCDGKSGSARCAACAALRKALAVEASRLHRRDIGRGVTVGTKEQYIAFAIESRGDGSLLRAA